MRTVVLASTALFIARAAAQTFIIDPSFDPGPGFIAPFNTQVALQPDGKILVVGYSGGFNGSLYEGITRLNPDGTRDLTFAPAMDGGTASVALLPDGRMIVAGSAQTCNGELIHGITRLLANGSNDPSFAHSTDGWFFSTAITPNGNIFAGGTVFSPLEGTVVYDASGTTIAQEPRTADCMQVQSDGNVMMGSRDEPYALRLLQNGGQDLTFSANIAVPVVGPGVWDITLLPDERALIAGVLDSVDHQSRANIARLNTNGSLDTSFDPGSGLNGEASAVLLLPDGDALVAGTFTTYNGSALNGPFARINNDGTLDTSYAISGVRDMLRQPDGKIMLVGEWITFDGITENGVMRIMPDINTSAPSAHMVTFSAWPNPASELLTIQRNTDGPFQWILTDAMGRTVKQASASGSHLKLPIDGLEPGTYTMRVTDERGSHVVRFTKE
ncbi:MAG: T9SS type A sorting domain-containing protein [Flavobacteriales bacterium]